MRVFVIVSPILASLMLSTAAMVMIYASRRPVNPIPPLPKRQVTIVFMISIGIALLGVYRVVGGPRWFWDFLVVAGFLLLLFFAITGNRKNAGFENVLDEFALRRDSALDDDDKKVQRVLAKVEGDGRDALILLDIKQGWWTRWFTTPRGAG